LELLLCDVYQRLEQVEQNKQAYSVHVSAYFVVFSIVNV